MGKKKEKKQNQADANNKRNKEEDSSERMYRYDAFISYRHSELDKYVAETLQKRLENFRLPRNILKKDYTGRRKINRVFRDQAELPLASNLEEPIVEALKTSEFLIVICSPRLKESIWCKKEIETFISLHGIDKVFAVLVEGEPEDSFPTELLYREEQIVMPNGAVRIERKKIEPLAADVRGSDKKGIKKAMDVEILRLLAPMFGLRFDDLRQRHREEKLKRVTFVSVAITLFALLFGALSTATAIRIKHQKEQIEEQSDQISSQAMELLAQSREIEEQNTQLKMEQALNLARQAAAYYEEDERLLAVNTAAMALNQYGGMSMPYTPEAQFELSRALQVYDNGRGCHAIWQMETLGCVSGVQVSPDQSYLLVGDTSGQLALWDIRSRERVFTTQCRVTTTVGFSDTSESTFAFVGDDAFLYSTEDSEIICHRISTGEETVVEQLTGQKINPGNVCGDCIYFCYYTLVCYNATTGQCEEYPIIDYLNYNKVYFSEDGSILCLQCGSEGVLEISFYHRDTMELISSCRIEGETTSDYYIEDGYAYIAVDANNSHASISDIYKVNISNGHIEYSVKSFVRVDSFEPNRKSDLITLIGGTSIQTMDINTGEEGHPCFLENDIVGYHFLQGDQTSIFTFTRDGKAVYVIPEDNFTLFNENLFECNCDSIVGVYKVENGYAVVPENDNRVIFYGATDGSERTEVSSYERENIGHVEEKPVVKAREYGLERAEMVLSILYTDDQDIMFVFYSDGIMEVYRTDNIERLSQFEIGMNEYDIANYYGRDQYGNYYIAGRNYGYCLNEDFKMIAQITALVGVEEDLVIVEGSSTYYSIPIYSVEELLYKAEHIYG